VGPSVVKRVPRPLIIIIRERIEGQIEGANVPQLSSVDPLWPGHPAVAYELVELASGNADVHSGFVTRKAAARDWPDGGKGGRAHHITRARSRAACRRRPEAVIEPSGNASAAATASRSGVSDLISSCGGNVGRVIVQ